MPQLLLLQEYSAFGLPVWRFAVSRSETLHVYAPSTLGERDPVEYSREKRGKVCAWVRTLVDHWGTLDLARFGSDEYSLYIPYTERDFHWLCRATARRGGCIELIAPSPLASENVGVFTPIWDGCRPLRHLKKTDLCGAVHAPWVYLLAIYDYAPCVSVFVAESPDMVQEVVELTVGTADCRVIPLETALDSEQRNWRCIYRQFVEPEQGRKKGKKGVRGRKGGKQ